MTERDYLADFEIDLHSVKQHYMHSGNCQYSCRPKPKLKPPRELLSCHL